MSGADEEKMPGAAGSFTKLEISGTADLIGRLHAHGLIGTGPRAPRRGAPYTFVTTDAFLAAFGLESLRDLPDPEQLNDAGLAASA